MSPYEHEVLLVEDDLADAELTVGSLRKKGNHVPSSAALTTKSAGVSK
jgi:hypothetical protein